MRGMILGFDGASGEGVITQAEGARFAFARADWRSPGEPLPGRQVDFEIEGNRAVGIFVVPGTAGALAAADQDPAQRATVYGGVSLACAVLTYMLGPFGIFTIVPALIFGVMGRNAGRGLADRTGYYLSVAGLVLSAIALAIGLVVAVMFMGFFGMLAWGGCLN